MKETLIKVMSHGFNLRNANTLEQQVSAIHEKKDYSFVVGYYLQAHSDEKLLREHIKQTKVIKKNYNFTFEQLNRIFSDPEKAARFQEIFTYYIIELPITYSRKPWRVGFTLSMNLKKIFKLIIKAANVLNIKLEKVPKESYRLKCIPYEVNTKPSVEHFFIEVFDNTDEYVVDFMNDNLSSLKFILICNKFIKHLKS